MKLTALVKRPDPEAGMRGRRGIKSRRDWQTFPESGVISDTCGKCIQRNIAERMVDEMAEQVGEQNQPKNQTDLPDADAADIFVKRRAIELSHVHNRRKNGECQSSSGDRTSNRFIPANVELAEPPIGEERVNIRLTAFNFLTSTKQPCIAQF